MSSKWTSWFGGSGTPAGSGNVGTITNAGILKSQGSSWYNNTTIVIWVIGIVLSICIVFVIWCINRKNKLHDDERRKKNKQKKQKQHSKFSKSVRSSTSSSKRMSESGDNDKHRTNRGRVADEEVGSPITRSTIPHATARTGRSRFKSPSSVNKDEESDDSSYGLYRANKGRSIRKPTDKPMIVHRIPDVAAPVPVPVPVPSPMPGIRVPQSVLVYSQETMNDYPIATKPWILDTSVRKHIVCVPGMQFELQPPIDALDDSNDGKMLDYWILIRGRVVTTSRSELSSSLASTSPSPSPSTTTTKTPPPSSRSQAKVVRSASYSIQVRNCEGVDHTGTVFEKLDMLDQSLVEFQWDGEFWFVRSGFGFCSAS